MLSDTSLKTVVLYHADCPDGFGAAFAAWKKLGTSATYLAVHHRSAPPVEVDGARLYMLDFVYPFAVMAELKERAREIVLIDHHVGAVDAVTYATDSLVQMDHSGAVLSWMYFYPTMPVPRILQYVEDADLWRFALPDSRAVSQAIRLHDFNFPTWERLAGEIENDTTRAMYVEKGRVLIERMRRTVDNAVRDAEEIIFEGYPCLITNSAMYASEIGEALVNMKPPIGIIWSRRKNKIVISLRSDGTVDVNELASRYGGGGHPRAAGFSWVEDDFLTFQKG